MNFSIIIATRNRCKTIIGMLSSLKDLDYPPQDFEIVVIDNNSTDQTYEALTDLQKELENLVVCQESRIGVSFARNTGIGRAKFRHLIFLDDDIDVKKSFLQGYRRAWGKYPEAGALGGKIGVSLQDAEISVKQKKMIKDHPFCFSYLNMGDNDRELIFGELLFAPNLSYKRMEDETQVFDTRLGRSIFNDYCLRGEEYELCKRLMLQGRKVIYVADPEIEVFHRVFVHQFSDDYILRRYYFAGIENYIMDTALKAEFPHMSHPITSWLRDGIRRTFSPRRIDTIRYCTSKYFIVMKISYFFNGRYFFTERPIP